MSAQNAVLDYRIVPTVKTAQITGTANAAARLVLPAPGAGLSHYIVGIQISRATGTAVTGSATLAITTTNLNSATDTTGPAAQGTITMSGVATADETFAIGTQTFTWKASRTTTGEVTIGADAAHACTNIIAAVNADLTTVIASQGAGTTVLITAASGGSAGNSIVFTEASTNMTVDGSGTLGATNSGGQLMGWVVGNALAIGAQVQDVNFVPPLGVLKAAAANTATTISCPAPGTGPIWSISVTYFVGP